MKAICIFVIILMLATSCTGSPNGNNSSEIFERVDEQLGESERVENSIGPQGRRLFPDDEWEQWLAELDRTNVESVIRGSYTPADRNADLRNIERFVFTVNMAPYGEIFVLDKLHSNRVYYSPFYLIETLEGIDYSSEFREVDLERLIEAIEASGLRDWKTFYEYAGESDQNHAAFDAGFAWNVGILFSDNTILRSGGTDSVVPAGWGELRNFIMTIGAEIEERHNAEQAAEQSDEQDG